MASYDLVIRNGTVVNEHVASPLDIYIRDGLIAALAAPSEALPVKEEVDATGLHVLPGIIDAHTHFRTFSKHSDDFAAMSRSAAHGGVTTVIAHIMGMNASDLRPAERAAHFIQEADQGASTDYGFHLAITDEPHTLEDIDQVARMGVNSFKMFMAYRARKMQIEDGMMLSVMESIRNAGGTVMVHAEAGDLADKLEADAQGSDNRRSIVALAESRPPWIEGEATRRALVIGEKAECPVYFVHVSCGDAIQAIGEARARGQRVHAETCPQYLNLTVDDFIRLGGLAKIAPPLRGVLDRKSLTAATIAGAIQVVASDHSPYVASDKQLDDIWAVPMGAPGTETLLPMSWRALAKDGAPVTLLARVLSAEPARIFGLYPKKGIIAVGSDADLTLVDLSATSRVDGQAQHNTSGYSVYDGFDSPLDVVGTYLRGQPLLSKGELVDSELGLFLPRGSLFSQVGDR